MINPPAVKSTILSLVASLIEPVEAVIPSVPVVAVIEPTVTSPKDVVTETWSVAVTLVPMISPEAVIVASLPDVTLVAVTPPVVASIETEFAAVTLVATTSPAAAEIVTASAEFTLVATTPSWVVDSVIASAVEPREMTSVAVISPAADTLIAPSLVSTSTSSIEPNEAIPISPAVRLETLTLDPSATSKLLLVNPVAAPISSWAVRVISPPAVKSTIVSSDASLIEPAVEVRTTELPTLKEPI